MLTSLSSQEESLLSGSYGEKYPCVLGYSSLKWIIHMLGGYKVVSICPSINKTPGVKKLCSKGIL